MVSSTVSDTSDTLSKFDMPQKSPPKLSARKMVEEVKSPRALIADSVEEALLRIKVAKESLPDCLKENQIKADKLLFKEA